MSSNLKEIFSLIEQLETSFDEYVQGIQKNNENMLQNLSHTWKMIKSEEEEVNRLEINIENQNSELTELKIKSDDYDKKIDIVKSTKEELTSKISDLKNTLERLDNDFKTPKLELEDLISKLNSINEKISKKEQEKTELDRKKIDNATREKNLRITYSEEKMVELNQKLAQLKRNNYFTTFLIENSEEEIPEVAILATIMDESSVKLDDLKKLLDVPPIMAVRTIKQLAVKGIVNLDENTNIITMP
jgi:DNA repair exonuclease SbcCD ATPase subunit